MRVVSLSVKNFRNLYEQNISFEKGLNVITGQNAQGKTNLMESIYLCSLGKSPRTEKHKDMINYQKDFARVCTKFMSRFGEAEISVVLFGNKKKSVSVNSVPILKTGEMLGYFNTVYFSPDEIRLIKSSPDFRRRFMDIDLSQTDKNYFYSLVAYNKILSQRNSLLKSSNNINTLKDMLFVWDTQLALECARIVSKRQAFCNSLKDLASDAHLRVSGGKEKLELTYQTAIVGDTIAEKQQTALNLLKTSLNRDFELRYTTTGCQRDDIKFCVNGIDVREFGSQGQQRTSSLALKLAELAVFKQMTGDYPVLMLDDVLSELDLTRQKQLLTFDKDIQIILTATHLEPELEKNLHYKKYTIDDGKVN
jgi:DNA replication and repair protein RecF